MIDENPLDSVEKLDAAFNQKDINAVLEFYDDEATMVVRPGTVISGKASLREAFKEIFELNCIAKQEKMQFLTSGDLVLFVSKWHLINIDSNGIETNKEYCATCVFRRNKVGK